MRRGIKDCIEPNSWTGERLLPQVITAFFREQSACNGRPATCGLRRSCFDLRVRRESRRCGPHRVRPLRRIEGMTRAHRAIFFVFRHSSLRARPSRPWSNPCPAGLYTMLRGRCHAPHPMMCAFTLHPPSCCVCGSALAWRLSRRPRAASVERAPCFGREAHAAGVLLARRCPWRWPRAREA